MEFGVKKLLNNRLSMSENKKYDQIYPEIKDWPIYHLSEDRSNFIKEIDDFTLNRIAAKKTDELVNMIATTVYMERSRIKEESWKVDPPNDRVFWKKISYKLFNKAFEKDEKEAKVVVDELLGKIIHRYSTEIVGTFKIPTFRFARRFLTLFFSRLLNAAANKNWARLFGRKYSLYDKLKLHGELDTVRELFKHGTVIVVPTHFSNLDSILVGYAMDEMLGLPSFSYGAGLNLYNSGIAAYFMNRLGAYRVDRRKKNPIYLETLKAMSKLSIQRGVNSLFFPGGTRSRSGSLEKKLKMGLIGTAVEAQRALCQEGKKEKIFIVPLVMSYHFVLEAKYLIEQHLLITGKEKYIKTPDDFYSIRKLLRFAWQFFTAKSEIVLSFGKPFDVLGNFVDKNGVSYDKFQHPLNIADYFESNGKVVEDLQRENEYTQMLADIIATRYHIENIVLSSHIVAFVGFNLLKEMHPRFDVYGLMRLPEEDFSFQFKDFVAATAQLQQKLFELEKNGKLKLSDQVYLPADQLVRQGIEYLGIYHTEKPLMIRKGTNLIESEDFKLLFFYHNRLENYHLDKAVKWEQFVKSENFTIEVV